ncbi:hypothetical protein [Vibrio cholerae]|uniref:hypothetical protein n=1 Tax=Vibrio cholerae TaxID=666 RepID=UPI00226F741C|nr:hypothetical protein [Vibrio cholerae]MCX9472295.1 hypothetical protein [Vibrio cholerae]MCX9484182.1 hypothetical protein [Vibrio cholerae]MCX9491242.1 hypothetical protein [Vibrio cholerae]HEJ2467365.1 hypothetical protein [Vibrio cholerae]
MAILKILGALLMLFIVGICTFMFGIGGFLVALLMSIFVSWSISKREKEALEKKRHEEIVSAIKKQTIDG